MALSPGENIRFDYNGKVQAVTLTPGKYRLQCYGAKGYNGSNGGYTSGYIRLRKTTTLYVNCGQSPTSYIGGWNGGGNCSNSSGYGGGGRTDISMNGTANSTSWNNAAHLNSIVLAAQGGQGGTYSYKAMDSEAGATLKTGSASYSTRDGVLVYTHTATGAYPISFYSTSYTKDPYGHVYKDGVKTWSNDDGGNGLNFSITFTTVKGSVYKFYVGAYSSAGSASYVIKRGDAQVEVTHYVDGGVGATPNYGYNASNVSSYPFGSCALDPESYLESYSTVNSSSSANGHGYAVITRVPVNIICTDCSASMSQVYGGEVFTCNASETLIRNNTLLGFAMYMVTMFQDVSYIRQIQADITVPLDIWYDIYIEAMYGNTLRCNSNFYRDSQIPSIVDLDKILENKTK